MSLGGILKADIDTCVVRISVGKGCEVHGVDLFPQGGAVSGWAPVGEGGHWRQERRV